MVTVDRIPSFTDNYIWALTNDRAKTCTLVDPGDAKPAIAYLEERQLDLTNILITHHHHDHTGGVETLKSQYGCLVYGPKSAKISGIDSFLKQGDRVTLPSLGVQLNVLEVPGHTLDHIAYVNDDWLFCGDTLFAGGCGRLFEGTPLQMWQSLKSLKALPAQTQVFCAHEYTQANLSFARAVEPDNETLQQRYNEVKIARANDIPTVPSTIELECQTNPFLRVEEQNVRQAAETFSGKSLSTPEDVFGCIRQWKDNF
ncbi:hydroxyacylglutathione hydrolase [Pleionea litopenaei]|uniref:Hydroxyacylglutathione hydrolase n=1 Tax=Pleionea litopenaei TaxID=3070815 RepID=A0AA51RVT1_9GAMM|nr:hydroxyacylglutathione hydrolase [Pleionea sp. HL-JVS1]WMS88485.1 hydroxyacylglutathione hydrolase [Pleionea sp. HL-JVS1]